MDYFDNATLLKPPSEPSICDDSFHMDKLESNIGDLAIDNIKGFNKIESELLSHMQIFDALSLLTIFDLNGNILYANDKFCKVSKYSQIELKGKPLSITRHPDTPLSFLKELWKTIGSGKVWHGEIKNKAKDGSDYWVLTTIVPVLEKDGKPIKYISMRVDITKQKLAEEKLSYAKEKVEVELQESINYAKHVHNSFLTSEEDLDLAFPESFLIYKAQNIISGDFYRVEKFREMSFIVVGDSTGHGVSASYISIMVLNVLSHLIKTDVSTPLGILYGIHEEIKDIRFQNRKNLIQETADMIVCCIDHKNMKMNYASAKMKGVIIRKNQIIELYRDRCSIGESSEKSFALSSCEIDLEKGDCLYLFTDGMTDQIGGEHDKTFKYKKLRQVLFTNHLLPMQHQKKNLTYTINSWKGENEQTDDMTLLGIRIS